ncbi:MAG: nicotinate-nucleotide--dimethylbenzimidazole phosphoribosyltransferase [Gammaproteobacteria bacterium]|nr:MAG: nicotinate-nucleotide--dimethylbenzimidazole phosphoribosyltransferase [Gammaproteobacteria bacterium]
MTDFEQWLAHPVKKINQQFLDQALARQQQLTKPAGSLGQLENVATKLAGLQGTAHPRVDYVQITIFAADHGIVEEGVSAFPQAVTAEMIRNFSRGGAAISVLAEETDSDLSVINMGTVAELEQLEHVEDERISAGTANFLHQAAMTMQQCQQAMNVARFYIDEVKESGKQLFIGGEMGIGNTSSATAIACALLNRPAAELVGPGTGLDQSAVQHKANIIDQALAQHQSQLTSPLTILQYLGGFEIAALTASYLQCAKLGLPMLIDGFISSVAALVAQRINPDCQHWFLFSHCSAEPGHQYVLAELKAEPLLNIGMRLGEGSGAAVALALLKLSCSLHNDMATFAEATVSEKSS